MDDRILSIVPSRNVVGPGAKFICVESCVVTTFRDFSKRSLRTVIKTGLAVGLVGVTMPDLIGPAQAQWERPRPEPQTRATNRKTQTKAVPAPVLARTPEAGSPLLALVSIGAQRLDIYDRKGLVASSPISSGRTGHESPQGVYSIIEKKEEHFSNLYDDASMPFMQRITWSGVAMHAGALPGYPASHGCLRLPHGFARTWFELTKLNTRVVITQNPTTPVSISHPALFEPRATSAQTPMPTWGLVTRNASVEAPVLVEVSLPHSESAVSASPIETARNRQKAAAGRAMVTIKAVEDARRAAKAAQLAAVKAERDVKAAEAAHKRAAPRLVAAERTVAAARTEAVKEAAEHAKTKVIEDLEKLIAAYDDAKTTAAQKSTALTEAQSAIKTADEARLAAQADVRDAARLSEPISVFVSRATQRVYIRQNREAVLDLPMTIRYPTQPLGTHVFTAMAASDTTRSVDWSLVTAAAKSTDGLAEEPGSVKGRSLTHASATTSHVREQALAALDRLEFPKEILDRVLPSLHVGSSLIVSDLGPSFETGKGTDFIVQTRGEEEARASVRRIVAEKRVGRGFERERDRRFVATPYRVSRSSSSWWWD